MRLAPHSKNVCHLVSIKCEVGTTCQKWVSVGHHKNVSLSPNTKNVCQLVSIKIGTTYQKWYECQQVYIKNLKLAPHNRNTSNRSLGSFNFAPFSPFVRNREKPLWKHQVIIYYVFVTAATSHFHLHIFVRVKGEKITATLFLMVWKRKSGRKQYFLERRREEEMRGQQVFKGVRDKKEWQNSQMNTFYFTEFR